MRFLVVSSASGLKTYPVIPGFRGDVTGGTQGTILSFLRNICLTGQNESSVTRERIDTLFEWLDRLGLWTNDGDAVHTLQSAQGDALFALVVLVVLLIPHLIFSSALGQTKTKLEGLSGSIEGAGHTGSNGDARVNPEPMNQDDIRAAIFDRQVSGDAQTASGIRVAD